MSNIKLIDQLWPVPKKGYCKNYCGIKLKIVWYGWLPTKWCYNCRCADRNTIKPLVSWYLKKYHKYTPYYPKTRFINYPFYIRYYKACFILYYMKYMKVAPFV